MTGPGGLLEWHPRDLDTLEQHYEDLQTERRMAAARAQYQQAMGG